MRSALFVMFTLVVAAACAESPKHAQQPASGSGSGSGSDSGVVCSEVSDTGSMFSHTECKPREQSQSERDDAQRWMKRPRSAPTHN